MRLGDPWWHCGPVPSALTSVANPLARFVDLNVRAAIRDLLNEGADLHIDSPKRGRLPVVSSFVGFGDEPSLSRTYTRAISSMVMEWINAHGIDKHSKDRDLAIRLAGEFDRLAKSLRRAADRDDWRQGSRALAATPVSIRIPSVKVQRCASREVFGDEDAL